MLNGFILLILGVSGIFLVGRWWTGHGEKWLWAGNLPGEFTVETVAVSSDGVGVVGGYIKSLQTEATPKEQMRQRSAILWRLEEKGFKEVYEGAGWIRSVHNAGSDWFAVVSTLKKSGDGSNHRLIWSSDHAKTWKEIGKIPVRSISQILSVNALKVYVFGVNTLIVTEDGGKKWNLLPFPKVADGRGFTESIALARDGGLLAFGSGLMLMRQGTTTWESLLAEEYNVEAVSDPFLVALMNKKVQFFQRTEQGALKVSELPEDRYPVRIAVKAERIRIITHPRHPEKLGFFSGGLNRVLFKSNDGGKSWKKQGLKSIQKADISGAHSGIGVDIRKGVFSTKMVNVK